MLLGVLVLVALGIYWLATEDNSDRGGVYVEAEIGSPRAINPLFSHFNDVDKDLVELIFSGLTKLGKNGQVLPALADRWSISNDNLTYTFHVNDQAKWQDGQAINSEDVLYTIGTIQSEGFPGSPDLASFWKDVQVEKVDSATVRFKLPRAFSPFLSYTSLGLLPSHLLKDKPAEALSQDKFNAFPIGSGRFIVDRVASDHVTLKSNPSTAAQKPLLDQIKVLFFATEDAAVAAVKSNKADGIILSPDVASESLNVLSREEDLVEHKAIRTNYTALFLNSKSQFFQDVRVRKATMLAIDRYALVKNILKGYGRLSDSPIVPNTWADSGFGSENIIQPDHNKASALLEDAGWKTGPNGIRSKDGVDFQFSLLTNDNPIRAALAAELSKQLQPLGIRAVPSIDTAPNLLRNAIIPRRFDVLLYGLDVGYDPDNFAVWHSSQDKEDGLNISSFSEPQVDLLLDQGRATPDPQKRADIYRKFREIFIDRVPSIVLYYPTYTFWVNARIKGVETGVLFEPSSRFSNIEYWYSETKRVIKGPG